MAALGPHSRPYRFTSPDKRTREAKAMEKLRAELTAHVGGSPRVAQRLLIERAVGIGLRIALLDRKLGDALQLTDADSKAYLGLSNAIQRTVRELGLKATPPPTPSLAEYLAGRAIRRVEFWGCHVKNILATHLSRRGKHLIVPGGPRRRGPLGNVERITPPQPPHVCA